jgi:hypothetical protein
VDPIVVRTKIPRGGKSAIQNESFLCAFLHGFTQLSAHDEGGLRPFVALPARELRVIFVTFRARRKTFFPSFCGLALLLASLHSATPSNGERLVVTTTNRTRAILSRRFTGALRVVLQSFFTTQVVRI